MTNLIEKCASFLSKSYTNFYKFILRKKNWNFLSILLSLRFKFLPRLKNFYFSIYVLEGKEKHGNRNLKVLFCGNKMSLLFFINKLFLEDPQKKFLGNFLYSKIDKTVAKFSTDVDLTIIKTDKFFLGHLHKKGFVIIPEWIPTILDISKPLGEIIKNFKGSVKRNIKKINKYNYSFEVTTDVEKFNYYFYKLRQEYFSKKVGEQAIPGSADYHDVRCMFNNGRLFLLKKDGKYIAGFLIIANEDKIRPHCMGIIDDLYTDKLVGSAIFYLFISWAKEQGFNKIPFGISRPFLEDGPLQFKKKWGTTIITKRRPSSIFAIKISNFENESIYDFLENNPFIYYEEKGPIGAIFRKREQSSDQLYHIYRKYDLPGFSRYITLQGKDIIKNFFSNYEGITDENTFTKLIDQYKISKEKIDPTYDIKKATQILDLKHISEKDVEQIIGNIVSKKREYIIQRGKKAHNPLMGLVMKELHGKAEGKMVSRLLETKINEILKKN